MRAVIQRVSSAHVSVEGEMIGQIGAGVLVFLGIGQDDAVADGEWLVKRITKLRIFESEPGKMDRSILDIDGQVLVISQFTLFGSLKKGNRPSFNRAAPPSTAIPLYEKFIEELTRAMGKPVPSGQFGADMKIEAQNDGPVTLIVDTQNRDF